MIVAREEARRAGQRVEAAEADVAVRVGAAEQKLATVQQELVTTSSSELTWRGQDAKAARARIDEQSETTALLRAEHDELRETARTAEQLRTQVATLQGAYDPLLERVGAGSEGTPAKLTAKKTVTTRKRSARERNDD